MNRSPALVAAVALAACARASGRVETLSQDSSFRSSVVAIAPVSGAGPLRQQLVRALLARLETGGVRGVDLQESDSVLAGSTLGLDQASDPRVLAEIQRATSANAVVLLSANPSWDAIAVQVLSTSTGDSVLRATVRPRGAAFSTGDEAAAAVANALAEVTSEKVRVKAAASEKADEIPPP